MSTNNIVADLRIRVRQLEGEEHRLNVENVKLLAEIERLGDKVNWLKWNMGDAKDEIERLGSALKSIASVDCNIPVHCRSTPETGMSPCVVHVARQALGGMQ